MDTFAISRDSRTYVPLRFVAEALGYQINYESPQKSNNNNHMIDIITNKENESFSYRTADGKISKTRIGSLENISYGVRDPNQTLTSHAEALNKLLHDEYNFKPVKSLSRYEYQFKKDVEDELLRFHNSFGTVVYFSLFTNEEKSLDHIQEYNAMIETLKYFSVNEKDGEALWQFINSEVKRTEEKLEGTATFGETRVMLSILDPYKGKRGIAVYFLLFNNGERSNEDGIFITDNSDGKISQMGISSLLNPSGGQRPVGSTIEKDIENINKNFYENYYNIKSTPRGYSFQEIENGTDPFAIFSISREDGKPVIYINDWIDKGLLPHLNFLTGERYIQGLNGVMESIKYYSDSYSDGEKVFAYIHDRAIAGVRITPESTGILEKTFGSTKVKIVDNKPGIKIIFE